MHRVGVRPTAAITALVVFLSVACPAWGQDASYLAGVAKVDITPDYPIRLSGFGFRRSESEGVQHPIHARALVVVDGDKQPTVLVTIDNCGVSTQLRDNVLARLTQRNIPSERFALLATHTHTAPMLDGVLRTLFGEPIPPEHQQRISRYSEELAGKIEQAIVEALANLKPARLSHLKTTVDFARNRRTAGGPVDHDLPVLLVHDEAGKLIAVHTSYACHCVTLSNNLISGDWAGYAAEFIEREFPDAIGLVSIGCGADQNPDSGVTGDRSETAKSQGAAIADAIKKSLTLQPIPVAGKLTCQLETIPLPLAPSRSEAEWQQRVQQGGAVGYHAQVQLDRIRAGQALPVQVNYPIQTWKFGDQLAMVFLPGEVVVDYSLRLKQEFDASRIWVCAYANDTPCYIPSERILREGGYEGEGAMVYYDLPQALAAGMEEKIIGEVQRQWQPEFERRFNKQELEQAWNHPNRAPSPQQMLQSLVVAPGFRVELVAAEPLIADPVAIAFGSSGELWVCQMGDYPTGRDGQFSAGGSIRRLVDTDQDGQFDAATTFLNQIPFPTGVLPWRDGILVCAAPDILWARDTDGDGSADQVTKLFSGFATHNYHARVNSLRYGLDGWVYGSGGLFGGVIRSHNGGDPVDVTGRDFRIDPDRGRIEPVSGQTQQGRSRNDWGDWFGCDNGMLARHYPLIEHYMARNPHVIPPATAVQVSAALDPAQIFGISSPTILPRSGPANRVTAACGLGVYRDELFGTEWRGDLFTCESVGNIVSHLSPQPTGVTFRGDRLPGQTKSEFLASYSPWFRPVEAISGPDGGLWIVDMCRWVIEHPQWIPPEVLADLDIRAGENQGRIFRVLPITKPGRPWRNLDSLSAIELVGALDTPNGPQRDLAMQMIIWRGDKTIAPELRTLLQSESTLVRLQALCTLDGLGCLEESDLQPLFATADQEILRHLYRLVEKFPEPWAILESESSNKPVVSDRAKIQWLWTLGELANGKMGGERFVKSWLEAMSTGADDPYVFAAACSSLDRDKLALIISALANKPQPVVIADNNMAELLAMSVAMEMDEPDRVAAMWIMDQPAEGNSDFDRLGLFLHALDRRQISLDRQMALMDHSRFQPLRDKAQQLLSDSSQPESIRSVAMQVLVRARQLAPSTIESLVALIEPRTSGPLQMGAIAAVDRADQSQRFAALFPRWETLTPASRDAVLNSLLSRTSSSLLLLQAIETKSISWHSLDASRRQQLLLSSDEAIRKLAEQTFLANDGKTERALIAAELQTVLSMSGDFSRGREVFRKSCAACHVMEGHGHPIGPDLAALANRAPAALLDSIIDPSRSVDARYLQYVAVTDDGRTLTGLLSDETANSFALVGQNNDRHVVLRGQLDELRVTQKSLMPEGIEKDHSPQDFADLLVYINQSRGQPKQAHGNQPRLITAGSDGAYELSAKTAAIYGQDINFESGPDTVGFWHGEQDHLEWTIDVERPGWFEVQLEWSCAPYSAGNRLVLEHGAQRLSLTVESTGAWNQFSKVTLGQIELGQGRQTMLIRPDGPLIKPALLDLRAIRLIKAANK